MLKSDQVIINEHIDRFISKFGQYIPDHLREEFEKSYETIVEKALAAVAMEIQLSL